MASIMMSAFQNARGVINLDSVVELLNALLQHVEQQNKVIAEIQHTMNSFVNVNTFAVKMDSMEEAISKLNSRCDIIHRATISQVNDKQYTAGELASSNFFQLQKLSKSLSICFTRTEAEQHYQEFLDWQASTRKLDDKLEKIFKSLDELNLSDIHMNDRLNSHESLIANKLDKNTLNHLQSLVNKVLTYDEFKEHTLQQLTENQAFHENIAEQVITLQTVLSTLQEAMTILNEESRKYAMRRDLHGLAKELKTIQDTLPSFAAKTSIEELRAALRRIVEVIEETQVQVIKTEKEVRQVAKLLPTKATIESVKHCVTIPSFQESIQLINEQLITKSAVETCHGLQSEIEKLQQALETESQRIAIALRFVDWFTSRGENYEHNIRIIDRHLKELVVSDKVPRVHSYYLPGNRVQFSNLSSNTEDIDIHDTILPDATMHPPF